MDENIKQKRSESQVAHSRRAARKHGLRSRQAQTGDTSLLAPAVRSRRVELLQRLAEEPGGLLEALTEKTADIELTLELAAAWLRDEVESVGPAKAFASPMLARLVAFHNTFRLNLAELHRMQTRDNSGGSVTAEEVLKILRATEPRDDDG